MSLSSSTTIQMKSIYTKYPGLKYFTTKWKFLKPELQLYLSLIKDENSSRQFYPFSVTETYFFPNSVQDAVYICKQFIKHKMNTNAHHCRAMLLNLPNDFIHPNQIYAKTIVNPVFRQELPYGPFYETSLSIYLNFTDFKF